MKTSPQTQSCRRGSWFRFRLRTLLLAVLALALPLGYLGQRIDRARRIRSVVQRLNRLGFVVNNRNAVELLLCSTSDIAENQRRQDQVESAGLFSCAQGKNQLNRDWLWFGGRGARIFGTDLFFVPEGVHGRGLSESLTSEQAVEFWGLIDQLPDLDGLMFLGDEEDALFASPAAAGVINRQTKLELLEIRGEVSDTFLRTARPGAALRRLLLHRVSGGSHESWREFFANTQLDVLQFYECRDMARILEAGKTISSLGELYCQKCELDNGSVEALLELRPRREVMVRWSFATPDDDTPLHGGRLTGNAWRAFAEKIQRASVSFACATDP